MIEAAEPFSNGVQIGLRVPVILIALVGIVLALVSSRRIGVLAGILGGAGALVIAVDQIVNIAWVVHLTSMADEGTDFDIDAYTTVSNTYTIADTVLITLGVALLVAAVAARRPGGAAGTPPQYPFPAQSPFPPQPQFQQPQQQYPLPPQQPQYPQPQYPQPQYPQPQYPQPQYPQQPPPYGQ